MKLNKLRKQIDQIDEKIVPLLNKRIEASNEISLIKRKAGKGVYSPDREQEVFNKVDSFNQGPLNKGALESIYREIMSSSLSLDDSFKVAYLGPEATFTHLASLKRFGTQVMYLPCYSIADVFLEVERGNAEYGVVPIENSIEGAVSHTLDMFVDSDLKICAQVLLNVSHNLLANCPKDKIKKVYSIGQVFGQCRIWLEKNLPGVEKIEVSSTTRAAQIASSEKNSASISSLLAASVYKLKVIEPDIEDSPHNITRFLVIGKNDVSPTGHDRTSILFSIKDKVGALYEMLVSFKNNKINLTKIESRPSKKKAWDYYFFVDLDGHKENPRVKKALDNLEHKCKFLKILGSYPVGE